MRATWLGIAAVTLCVGSAVFLGARGVHAPNPPSAPQGSAAVGTVLENEQYKMIRISPGEFEMGSPPDEPGRYPDETRHPVQITHPFLLGTTEVTARLWLSVEGQAPPGQTSNDLRQAVTHVNWFSAATFCNHLSAREGLEPAYTIGPNNAANGHLLADVTWNPSASGYRLPTEAEWEYAARANTTQRYANDASRKNAWGLFDMSGNLWEWVWDPPGEYPAFAVDPAGPGHGYFRVLRGGSFRSTDAERRVAMRGWNPIYASDETTGLRLARSILE